MGGDVRFRLRIRRLLSVLAWVALFIAAGSALDPEDPDPSIRGTIFIGMPMQVG